MPDTKFQLHVTKRLRKKLTSICTGVGFLAGWHEGNAWTCVDCATTTDYFLQGLENVGFFCCVGSSPEGEQDLLAACRERLVDDFKAPDCDCLVIFVRPGSGDDSTAEVFTPKVYSSYYCSLEDVQLVDDDADISSALLFRAKGDLQLIFEGSADSDLQKENLDLAIERLNTTFHSNMPVFHLKDTKYLLRSASDGSGFMNMQCKDLLKSIEDTDFVAKSQKKSKKLEEEKVPVNFDILLQTTGKAAIENNVSHSLVIHCQRREFLCVSTVLPVDVLVVVKKTATLSELYGCLVEAISAQFHQFQESLLAYCKGSKFLTPEVYHFYPYECDFPVTVIYPSELSDEELEKARKAIHYSLLLPSDRPYLRKTNRHKFPSSSDFHGRLINPHIGLPPSGVENGSTATVYGRYAYHHYMQDQMNDDGWGCAYRSLQTIISWFRLQGYTERSIPTHKEIQQALVDIGDKPASFVGSRQWIGSQEVSFCLDHFLGVTSKIMCINTGAELANKGRELLHHFQSHGTPVMIGGGVLAHTILGVDFNMNTGDLKFLVLDPHYTGSEDLSTVQSKGWCGWKKADFWNQNSFYNLCLPQRPLMI